MEQQALVNLTELDEAIVKAERLNELLEEANSLVKELASNDVTVFASIKNLENSN